MTNHSSTRVWIAVAAITSILAALTLVTTGVSSAQAQNSGDATFELTASESDPAIGFRTVAVSFTGGDTAVAAFGAELGFDTDAVQVGGCELAEVGACNVTEQGKVLVSVFNLSGIDDAPQLLTIDFVPAPGATGRTTFDWQVTTAVGFTGDPVSVQQSARVDVDLAPTRFGSLTGDVIAANSQTGLFDIDVCVTTDPATVPVCTSTTGLGTWRLDDLPVGFYTVTVSDSRQVYAPVVGSATVRADEIVAGVDAALLTIEAAAETPDAVGDAPEADDSDGAEPPVNGSVSPRFWPKATPLDIDYDASITGRVLAIDTGVGVATVQVCATQPLVLHQSCGTTDADGRFVLDGISAGNYWLTTVDPLGRFEDAEPELVGVVGDDIARSGVRLIVSPTGS